MSSPPGAADVAACQQLFRNFAQHSAKSAPFYGVLAHGIADDPALAALLLEAPPEQRQPVLFFACVHWLVLHHREVELARYYPNLRSPPLPRDEALPVLRAFCSEQAAALADLLRTRRTQTNEIGRTALFVPVFGELERHLGPLGHVDVGASAGLNLLSGRFDFRYEPGGELVAGSPVVITCGTRGDPPIPRRHPRIETSVGLDASPLDVGDADQARWLEACVWPDQVERFARLAAAVGLACRHGVDVRRGEATADTPALIDEVAAAGHPIVTTSWVLNYMSAGERERFVDALDECGRGRDLSWLYAENPTLCPELPAAPARRDHPHEPTALVLVRWRAGRRTAHHLADTHPHGRWMQWISSVRP